MATINNEILNIAHQACLKILADDKIVYIKHKFRINDKATLGVLFFLPGGLFLIAISFFYTSDSTSKIIGFLLGFFMFVFSVFTLIRDVTDGLVIRNNLLTFRYNLKQTTIPLTRSLKIKMKTELVKIRRAGTLGSDFIIVTHYLIHQNKEIPILKFQMDNTHADSARKLGSEMTRIINAEILQCTAE